MPDKSAYPNLDPPRVPASNNGYGGGRDGWQQHGAQQQQQHNSGYGGNSSGRDGWQQHGAPQQQPKTSSQPARQPPSKRSDPPPRDVAAMQPPPRHEQGQHRPPLAIEAVKAPFKLVNAVFGVATRGVLGPLRAALGQQIPFSRRRHLVIMPEALEAFMGDMTFAKIKATEKVLPAGHKDSRLVERIGRRIVNVLPGADSRVRGYTGHLRGYKWEFLTVQSDQVNAFVAPGGKVVVYTGLLDMLSRDEDKLATVLGHEASHVLARHSAEGVGLRLLLAGVGWALCSCIRGYAAGAAKSYRSQQLTKALQDVERQYAPGSREHQSAVRAVREKHDHDAQSSEEAEIMMRKLAHRSTQVLLNLLVGLPNSRRAEREADLVGVRLVQRAGFNIHKAPQVWDDFARMSGPGSEALSVLQTHPASSKRKQALEKEVARLQRGGGQNELMDGSDDEGGPAGLPAAKGYFAL